MTRLLGRSILVLGALLPFGALGTASPAPVKPKKIMGDIVSSAQTFRQGDAVSTASTMTIQCNGGDILNANELHILIPTSLGMTWDTTFTTPTISAVANASVAPTGIVWTAYVTFITNRAVRVWIQGNFAPGDYFTVSGLRFTNFTGTSDVGYLQLSKDGNTVYDNDGNVTTFDETDTYAKTIAGSPTMNSGSSQIFRVGDAATTAYSITITDHSLYPGIVPISSGSRRDIRIRLPSSSLMTWDTTVAPTYSGSAYTNGRMYNLAPFWEDGNRTCGLYVLSAWGASESLTVTGLRLTNFSGVETVYPMLETNNNFDTNTYGYAGTPASYDYNGGYLYKQTAAQPQITMTSQSFTVGDPATAANTITITEAGDVASIGWLYGIKIRIPSAVPMTWDTTDTAVTFGGTAAGLVSGVSFPDNKTCYVSIPAFLNFSPGQTLTISGLTFNNFTAYSSGSGLELDVDGDVAAEDAVGASLSIGAPTIQNWTGGDQFFNVGDDSTTCFTFYVYDGTDVPRITIANDIRVKIPAGLGMTWDTTVTAPAFTGVAPGKVSPTVTYEDAAKTVVIHVTADWVNLDYIFIDNLKFTNFTVASGPLPLELEVNNQNTSCDTDGNFKRIGGTASMSVAANQAFTVSDPVTAMSPITITDGSGVAMINTVNDIRIKIPGSFNMIWDTTDITAAAYGGSGSGLASTTVSYEDSGRTLVIPVTGDFSPSMTLIVSGLSFRNFTAASAAANLTLELDGDVSVEATAAQTISIGAPTISSAASQGFNTGDTATAISTITVTDGAVARITAANDIRIRIPATFDMTWLTTDLSASLGGTASAKVSGTVSYEDAGQTLVLDVTADFAPGQTLTVSLLSFTSFNSIEAADNLELEVNNLNTSADEDDKTIQIGGLPTISSAAGQAFTVGDPATAMAVITITDSAGVAMINTVDDIRIKIPASYNMTWDTTDTTANAYGGTGAARASTAVSYADSGRTLVIPVTVDFTAGMTLQVSGLSFANFTAASSGLTLTLEVDGDVSAEATDAQSLAVGAPVISSAANQVFNVGDTATAVSLITVTDGATARITAVNDIRVKIPGTFNMLWDTLDVTAVIGGTAIAKASTTVTYEDGGRTLVVNVTADFTTGQTLTISGLSFTTFTAASSSDNLELEVNNLNTNADEDDKTILLGGAPSISSAANQAFTVGDAATAAAAITITDAALSAKINTTNDIRIKIPGSFPMLWDTLDTTATFGGGAAGKAGAITYEDAGRTLVIAVSTNFAPSDVLTVSGLSFTTFSASSAGSAALTLECDGDGTAEATDDKTIGVGAVTFAAGSSQAFTVNDPVTATATITITEDAGTPRIKASNDIRIKIPTLFNMIWDTTDTTATLGGTGAGNCSPTVSYEDSNRTLVVAVGTDFSAGQTLTIAGLSYRNFTAASAAANLTLEIDADGTAEATAAQTIAIGAPVISSAANQMFTVGDAATPISLITVTDGATARITAANDVRIKIPAAFGMVWDTTDTTAVIGGTGTASTTVTYEDVGKTLVVNVTVDLSAGQTLMVSGLSFTGFSASATDNLELETNNQNTNADEDDKTVTVAGQPAISSAANQAFTVGDAATTASTITITDAAVVARINTTNDIRIKIPGAFPMVWDTLDTTATLTGGAAGKASGTVTYEDSGRTLVIAVSTNFSPLDVLTVSGLSFTSFSGSSGGSSNLTLECDGDVAAEATEDKTIGVGAVTIAAASSQAFTVNDPVTAIATITITEDAGTPRIKAASDLRIKIPAGFNMIWDTLDTTATLGGTGAGNCSPTVTYEDSNRTLVVAVGTDFSAGQTLTIAGLSYRDFTGASAAANLTLEIDADATAEATAAQTIAIGAPVISSAANQTFNAGDGATAISTITVTNGAVPRITALNDVRIKIPAGFNMVWDTLDTTAVIGGTGSASTTVTYEDAGKTLVVDVMVDFGASATLTVSGLSFMTFTGASAADNLELEVNNANTTCDDDDKTVTIGGATSITSVASQAFSVGDAATAISLITITDGSGVAKINTTNDIRVKIPGSLNMAWDTLDTAATLGGSALAKASGTVTYEDSGRTLVIPVTTNFAPSDVLTVSGLSFANFTASSAAASLTLEVDADGTAEAANDKTLGVGAATFAAAASQAFTVNDPVTAISTLTVTEDALTPRIKAANEIRIKIPAGFNMIWDTTDTTATLGGTGAGNCSPTVTYEDSNRTLVVAVGTDFSAGQTLTIAGLSYRDFTGASAAANLTLEIDADATAEATAAQTIAIGAPVISSAANQTFNAGDGATAISTITVTNGAVPRITALNDVRIKIPAGFNMVWDTLDTTAVIGGTGSASTTVTYEDAGKTLVVDVMVDFGASATLTVSGLSFMTFTGASAADNLELEVNNANTTCDDDDKTVTIGGAVTISSAASQAFTVGDAATANSAITITDGSGVAKINTTNDIRIKIPGAFPMVWDTLDTTATFGGGAAGKAGVITYEDSGRTLVIAVTTNFSPSDVLTVSGLSFTNFSASSGGSSALTLEVDGDVAAEATDDKTIGVGAVTIAAASSQAFTVNDPVTAIATITITEDAGTPRIKAASDLRIKIPAGFNMIWDTTDTAATLGGSGSASTTVSYEDSGKTLVVDVTGDFLAGQTLTIAGLSYRNFTGASAAANLTLEIDADATAEATAAQTIAIGAPVISSAANQTFNAGDGATAISTITVTNGAVPRITALNDVRIKIPAGFNMVWDTLDTTAVIGGTGSASTTVTYEDAGKTLVVDVMVDFGASATLTVSGLSFMTFTGASAADNLELEVNNANTTCDDDDKTVTIGGAVTISSAASQAFTVGDAATANSAITITDGSGVAKINTTNDIRIKIPGAFPMVWDTLDTTATFGGGAAGKAGVITYEDSGRTLVIAVTTNFSPSDVLTVSGLSFTNFSASSGGASNLALECDADGTAEAADDKTIAVGAPALVSGANRVFTTGDPATSVTASGNSITVTDDAATPRITAAGDLRIKIPAGFNMRWDTADTAAVLGGSGAVNCSTTVSYEDGGKTLVIAVNADFTGGQTLAIDGLSFANFTAGSVAGNLTLELDGDSGAEATDTRTIAIGAPTISSAANQTFSLPDPPTAISAITYLESAVPRATTASGIRIRIPVAFNMLWDTNDTSATLGGSALAKASATVSYADAGKTLVVTVTTNFAAGDTLVISDLSFTSFSAESAADNLELVLTGSSTADEDDKTKQVGGQPTLSSTANQSFTVNDPATGAGVLTITDAAGVAKITVGGDLRVRIPASLNLTWNTLIGSVTLGGAGAGNLSTAVSYPDTKTLLLDVTTGFAPLQPVTVSGLQFTNFSAASSAAFLTLDVNNDGTGDATDDKTRAVGAPTLASASSQVFVVGDPITAASTLTAADDSITPRILAASDLRVRIPASLNMIWDTLDTAATLGGTALAKASATVAYEDSGKTLVVDVTTNFAAGETLTISGVSFRNFTAASAAANLELETNNLNTVADLDGQTKAIQGALSLASAANQAFTVNDPATLIQALTVTDAAGVPAITAANDIRIKIPAGFNMRWDTTDTTVTRGGGAAGKVSATVSYEDSGRILVVNVTTNFAASDVLVLSDLSFTSFTGASALSNLTLEVDGDIAAEATDTRSIGIGAPTLSSASSQVLVVGDPPSAASVLSVVDGSVPRITTAGGIRIRIPAGLAMIWDTLDTAATLGGTAIAKASPTVSFEDVGKTLVVAVVLDFAGGDTLTIDGVSFRSFTAPSAPASLELETNNLNTVADLDDKTKAIQGPLSLASAANQAFGVGDPATAAQSFTVTDAAGVAAITAANDIRIKIPAAFNMTWDTTDTSAAFSGAAAGKVTNPVSYEDGGRTLVINVTTNFSTADVLDVAGLSFANFSGGSAPANMTLEVDGDVAAEAADTRTIAVGAPVISSAANQNFGVGDPATAIGVITVTDGATARITALNDVRIRIPSGFNMTWDTLDTTAVITGSASTTVTYEDAGKTLVVDVTADFGAGATLTVSGLSFLNFSAESAADNLELEVNNLNTSADEDDKTIQVGGQLTLSSAASVAYTAGDAASAIPVITVTDAPGIAKINTVNDIRIKIPAGFNMTWDTLDTTATFGGAALGKVGAITYEDLGRTLVIAVTTNFAAGDVLTIGGLSYTSFTGSSAAGNLTLEVDGDVAAEATDDKTIAVGAVGIASAGSQVFTVNDPATGIAGITVTDDASTPRVKAASDLRIKIPAGFNMTWDTTDTAATFGGAGAARVTNPVSYEDAGRTLVVNVTADFAGGDVLTIGGLSFANFSGASAAAGLGLEIDGDAAAEATTAQTVAIGAPVISSAANQSFNVGDPATAIGVITVTDGATARITALNDVRIRIPSGFNMTWDTLDTTAVITGSASTTVTYEDAGKTLVVDVTADFGAGATLTVSGLSFRNFTAESAADNLELEVNNLNTSADEDDKTIQVGGQLTLSSAASVAYTAGDAASAIPVITVTDAPGIAKINTVNDIRIKIPAGFNMTWDTLDTTATFGGAALGKVGAITYEDLGRTLVIAVTTNFAAGDVLTIGGLSYTSFTGSSAAGNLTLEVDGDVAAEATDDKTIAVGAVGIASAGSQVFTVNDPATGIAGITVTDDASTPRVKAASDLRIKIPAGFNMTWDTTDTAATFGGAGAARVTNPVSYEDAGRTLVVNVTADFAGGDVLTIGGLSFANFSGASAAAGLGLEIDGDAAAEATTAQTVAIGAPVISSAANQSFNVGDPATAIGVITVTDGATARITALNDVRIRIPSGFNMTWDTLDTTAVITGSASTTVTYEDAGKTLVVDVTADFGAGATLTVSGLSFRNFTAESAADNLELEVNNLNTSADEDDKTIQVGGQLTLSSAASVAYTAGDAASAIPVITVTDAPGIAKINTVNDIRIKIPAGFNMTWDTLDTTATFGGAALGKVGAITYEDLGRTLVIAVTTNFAAGDVLTIGGLSYTSFTGSSAAGNLTLEVDGDVAAEATDDKTIAVGAVGIASAGSQVFTVNDPATGIAGITVTDDASTPRVKAASDLRIKIPAGFNMTWDTTDTAATFGGAGAARVTNPVSYEDAGRTLVVNVTADFAGGDVLTIGGLSFANFSGASAAAGLGLEIDGDAAAEATTAQTVAIGAPVISSAANQSFNVGDPATAIGVITVTDGATARITALNDVRIRIPSGFNMTWDTLDTTAVITGSASTTVTYEDAGKTLVVDVTADFGAGATLTVSGLSFRNFTAESAADNLELEVNNLNTSADEDDKTIQVGGQLTLSSAASVAYTAGDAASAIPVITVTDAPGIAKINTVNDIRIKIPAGFNMTWDTLDTTATFGGAALGKVGAITYEDLGRTLVIAVTTNFAAGDVLTIGGLSYTSFTGSSAAGNLTLEVDGDVAAEATDDKTIAVGAVGIASAGSQVFTVNDPPMPAGQVTVSEDPFTPRIKAAGDLRIKIPAAFNMTWDTTLTSPGLGGAAASRVAGAASYEDAGRTLRLDVTTDFLPGDVLTVSGLSFMNFTAGSLPAGLSLEIDGDAAPEATTVQTVAIGAPTISSGSNQAFSLGNPPTPVSPITIVEGAVARITAAGDFRVRIPAALGMTWDTTDTAASFGGTALGKASSTVSFADGGKTLVVDVTVDFAPGDTLILSGLSFADFSVVSGPDSLELDTSNQGTAADEDDKTLRIGGLPTISSAANQAFSVGDPVTPIQAITVTDAPGVAVIRAAAELRIKIPPAFNMIWDTTDVTAVFGGATGKVGAVSYEDAGYTLRVEVTADFAPGETLTIAGLGFRNFSGFSPANNLGLEVDGDPTPEATDDKTIAVGATTLSSSSSQVFSLGDPATAASDLVVADGPVARVAALNDIRIRIPAGLSMLWDTTDTTAVLGGSAAGKASTGVAYEDAGKTLVVDVTSDFAPGDFLVVSGLSFAAFSGVSSGANLELEINNANTVADLDDKAKAIRGSAALSSASNQAFTRGDPAAPMVPLTVTDAGGVAAITASGDIRIRIPVAAGLTWDTTDTTAVLGGSAAASANTAVAYEDAGLTLVVNVNADFAPGDTLVISGLSFANFNTVSSAQFLTLEVDGDGAPEATDDKTLGVGAPALSSAANQGFGVGDPPQAMAALTITEDAATPRIKAAADLRVRIPAAFNMTWDTTDTTALLAGSAAAKASPAVTFEDAGKTLVIDVVTDFLAGETLVVSGLNFGPFTGFSTADNLRLEVNNLDTVCSVDDKTLRIGTRPTIVGAVTGDANGNGSIDRIVVTFSEDLDGASTGVTAGLGFTLAGYTIAFGVETAPGVVTYYLPESGLPDTGATPGLSYDPVVGNLLDADQGLEPIAYGPVPVTDGAPPRLIGFAFADTDSDGFLNSLTFTFSETLAAGDEDLSDWAVVDGNGGTNLLAGLGDGAVAISGNLVVITLADLSGSTALPRYRYVEDASGGALRDLVGLFVPSATNNNAPVAKAGIDRTLVPTVVSLDASGSSDVDGQALTFSWVQTGGSAVVLSSPGSAATLFTAIAAGPYTFEVTVSDGLGIVTDSVTITIQDVPPSTSAGLDQTVTAGATVTLDGSATFDTNGDPVTFAWTQVSGTAVVLSGAATAAPTFPTAGLNEVLVFRLTASDPGLNEGTDDVVVRVNAPLNGVPTADAGGDLVAVVGATVTLDGRRSSDPDGDALTYAWSPAALLAGASTPAPTFTPGVPGTYEFILTVTDDDLVSGFPDTVRVTVLPAGSTNRPPTPSIVVAPSAVVSLGTTVTLDASGSSDPDGQRVRYAWTQAAGPIVFFTDPAAAAPTFVPVVAGTYEFQLVVGDGTLEAVPIRVIVQAVPPAGTPPTALIFVDPSDDPEGDGRISDAASPITIHGTSSLGTGLAFAWTQTSGAAVEISNAATASMAFSPPVAGVYRFLLQVRDTNGLVDVEEISLVADTAANTSPTANAGPDQSAPALTTITLDGTASADPGTDADGVVSFGTGLLAFWRQVSGPAAALSDPVASRPTFRPVSTGVYVFEIVVSDGRASSPPDTVAVTVTGVVAGGGGGGGGGCGLTGFDALLAVALAALLRRARRRHMGCDAAR